MAIQTETYMLNNREFIRTWSDERRYVVRDGVSYEEANDPADTNRTYSEGDLIDSYELETPESTEAEKLLNYLLTGVAE